ncbi:MAG: hypothetical protein ACKOBW_17930 [Planctomycetota bacterium]
MHFDRTRIEIRERTLAEIIDLALLIVRQSGGRILLAMLPLTLVMAAFNHFLIGWMASWEYYHYESDFIPVRYVVNMSLLIFLEVPFVSVVPTLYLGQYVFHDHPSLRRAWRELPGLLVPVLINLVVWRGPAIAVLLLWNAESDANYSAGEFFLLMWCGLQFLLRTSRPYLPEIVLLERHPLRGKKANQVTVGKRNQLFHRFGHSNTFSRSIGAALIAVLLACAMAHGALFMNGVFLGNWRWSSTLVNVAFPAAVWLAAAFVIVIRFLNYLDVRIRDEGWEIDLRLRSEANRLIQRMTGSTP